MSTGTPVTRSTAQQLSLVGAVLFGTAPLALEAISQTVVRG